MRGDIHLIEAYIILQNILVQEITYTMRGMNRTPCQTIQKKDSEKREREINDDILNYLHLSGTK